MVERLSSVFKQDLDRLAEVKVELVSDHADARARAAWFISESAAPALIIAGGGGGTLRAVIEGIYDTGAAERVRVGALRMGSGNVLAKQFGVPGDPLAALHGLLSNLKAGRTVPCCVMRGETWNSAGEVKVHHAVTLGGLGQFGRIPSDLVRWHGRFPGVHKVVARTFGIEKLTNIEYALAFLIRYLCCVLFPIVAETIEMRDERFRLLSGVVMNFPIAALPFKPGVTVKDEVLSIYMIPLNGHTRIIRVDKNQHLDIHLSIGTRWSCSWMKIR